MGGYKPTAPRVYVVFWPHADVIKVGFSAKQRYRTFVLRGAEVVSLYEFDRSLEAFALEALLGDYLDRRCPRAFTSADEAERLLGHRGDGWKECWAALPRHALTALRHMPQALLEHPLSIAPQMPRTNGRTDGRTDVGAWGMQESHVSVRARVESRIGRSLERVVAA